MSSPSICIRTTDVDASWAGCGSPPRKGIRESTPCLTLLLSSMGCAVDTVSNGAEALAAAHETTYDLILMDCQMPEVDGYQATREIRVAEGSNRHVPIVGMSGYLLEWGADVTVHEPGSDDPELIRQALLEAAEGSDIVVTNAGASAGT